MSVAYFVPYLEIYSYPKLISEPFLEICSYPNSISAPFLEIYSYMNLISVVFLEIKSLSRSVTVLLPPKMYSCGGVSAPPKQKRGQITSVSNPFGQKIGCPSHEM